VKYAGQLKGRLLIAHGTGDDNVHYANTLAVINDLIDAGKYVEVLAFPGRGHGSATLRPPRPDAAGNPVFLVTYRFC